MKQTLTNGCNPCPNCHTTGLPTMNSLIWGWICTECKRVGFDKHLPKTCPSGSCADGTLQSRILRTVDACVCPKCETIYALSFGVFESPTAEELKAAEAGKLSGT